MRVTELIAIVYRLYTLHRNKRITMKITPFLSTLIVFAGFGIATPNVHAQEEFLLEAGKQVAIFAVKKLASAAYDADCHDGKANKVGPDKAGDLICMAVGSLLEKDKEEFRRDVRDGLKKLDAGIKDIEKQLGTLRDGQADLHKALDVVALAVDLIPGETAAHNDLIELRGAWNDHFKPMISPDVDNKREFDHERNLAYANYLISTLGIERNMSRLNETLVRPNAGNKPALLEQHFNRIMASVEISPTEDLEQPYLLLSSILESLMIEQARGEIMYAWAAAIIEADCSNNGDCTAAKKLPHTTAEFQAFAKRHRSEQLNLFNTLVERMVLDRSDLVSNRANFLHHDASLVFASADLFSAIHMRDGFGIRGRVISAGEAFSGAIQVAGKTISASEARSNKSQKQFDWWSKPKGAAVYETVHFSKKWLSYDVVKQDSTIGKYLIDTEFPWTSGPVNVRKIDLQTGRVAKAGANSETVVEFGSFLAIARAGGSYAMMNNAWDIGSYGAGGTSSAPTLNRYVSGKVVYASKSVFDLEPRLKEGDTRSKVGRLRGVIVANGGKVKVTMKLSPAGVMYPGNTATIINADAPIDSAVIYSTDYNQPPLINVQASFKLQSGLFFSSNVSNKSISWVADKKPKRRVIGAVSHERVESKSFQFKSGVKQNVSLQTNIKYSMPTSGINATNFKFFAGIAPTEIYLTKD